ncbi:hypothetical protein GGE67_005486 [Rhizobium leucaenae]|nr:hypothetical protein [Rhizobium leucaenae]
MTKPAALPIDIGICTYRRRASRSALLSAAVLAGGRADVVPGRFLMRDGARQWAELKQGEAT